ncbi:putative metal homeostasis protein [Schleiferilactobacillus shenzhenensis]|uniref:Uncharacterized protein n=1 Tax=Schleiferilactobacillus shenzhenensis LY-73 TaxID=1231336 RepID=U4TUF5_9LACO|nr:putative metal homeostasis protein [Schleiferilactobacillus shenzhenensis]ERL65067.1 hypothetical protein L248_3005 [Schleiferilactobacillus shenzhenensis LY-73]
MAEKMDLASARRQLHSPNKKTAARALKTIKAEKRLQQHARYTAQSEDK